jgi:Protein of unknown function (DUF2844)
VNQKAVFRSKVEEDFAMTSLNSRDFRIALCSAVLISALCPRIASATLGEPEVSVQADSAKLQSSVKMTNQSLFRVHEMTLETGTVVREFAGLDGKVFAVSWHGPYMPNLRQTLGKYFDLMTAAPRAHADRNYVQIHQGDLVVQNGGHMMAFSGRAYLTSAIPAGVTLGDLH